MNNLNVISFNTDEILTIGDLHGRFNDISYFIRTYDLTNCAIIVCGDIGMGFHKPEYYKQTFAKLQKILSKRNILLLLVRGNHDDPSSFIINSKFNRKNIKLIEDYSVLQFYSINDEKHKNEPFNILVIGGAISIDRTMRIVQNDKYTLEYSMHHPCNFEDAKKFASKCYWENEYPIYNVNKLNEIKKQNIKINAVVSHTCPDFCQPCTKDGIKEYLKNDNTLENDIDNERQIMTNIYNKIIEDNHPLTDWSYGHYHFHNMEYINNIRFTLLDMARNGKIDFISIKRF